MNITMTIFVIFLSIIIGCEIYKYIAREIEKRRPLKIAREMEKSGELLPLCSDLSYEECIK